MVTLEELLALVRSGRHRFDGDEVVDDLAHALQTAALALADEAPADMVAAALLHDVGHHPVLTARWPLTSHEQLGAELLLPHLGTRAATAVREHVAAKRHLAATEPGYLAALSPASRESLDRQGGPAVLRHLVKGKGRAALQLRRWDDAAKVPGRAEPPFSEVAAVVLAASVR